MLLSAVVLKNTKLKFRGKLMSLSMLKDLWQFGQMQGSLGDLRIDVLTDDHWPPKKSYSRMRVHLSVQAFSQCTLRLIDRCAPNCGGISKYSSQIEVIKKVDRLVDICNNTSMSNRNEFKGCEMINSPDHFHLEELFDILELFSEWRAEAGKNQEEFITWQSYEDLCWLVFGIVGMAKTYL